MTTSLSEIRRFRNALSNALYDRTLEENGTRIQYFFDADALISSVKGLTRWNRHSRVPELDSWQWVTRALLSAGFLPKVSLLKPHLFEFDRFISNHVTNPGAIEGALRVQHMKELASQFELGLLDERLNTDDFEALAQAVRDEGFGFFVRLELCAGGYAFDRLHRIGNRLAVEEIRRPRPFRPDDHALGRCLDAIRAERSPTANERRDLNNRVDAHALLELMQASGAGEEVRFYTQTGALRRVFARLAEELSDNVNRTLFRCDEYWVMRASFRALAFPHLGHSSLQDTPHFNIGELEELEGVLDDILGAVDIGTVEEAAVDGLIAEMRIGGQAVAKLIYDFYELKFLRSVFLRWEEPTELDVDLLPFVRSFFSKREKLEGTRQRLAASFSSVAEALTSGMGYLKVWSADLPTLQQKLENAAARWENTLPDPWRDLGLGRWGLQVCLPLDVRKNLESWLRDVLEGRALDDLADSLATVAAGNTYESPEHFALTMCQLWSLQCESLISREWQDRPWEGDYLENWMPLEVLALVSDVKSARQAVGAKQDIRDFIQRVVDRAEDLRERCGVSGVATIRAAGLMGVAHVTYWAWNRMRELGQGESRTGKEWARRSFGAAREAMDCLSSAEGSLMWLFALNHAAYIGIRATLDLEVTHSLVERLLDINAEYDHYRIADTRARRHTDAIKREVAELGVVTVCEDVSARERICGEIHEAKQVLLNARPWFGDEEVQRHWDELVELRRSLGCGQPGVSLAR